ncbi:hypothetical protein ANN_12803 [Periplaneta americana]|uniref:Per a allergen n=1 Tax=Periplaneta americana TaxID=6978 RepID=A0ABQ8THK9_PERAM|nr:hypothetical protein ANN_12803 [Periplaneta americana]
MELSFGILDTMQYENVLLKSSFLLRGSPRSHCLAKDGSSRRVEIIAIDRINDKAIIIDPTVRFETAVEQPVAVHEEKKTIYDPTIQYFRDYYHIQGQIEVFGLLFGARGTIPKFSVESFKSFGIPLNILKIIAIDKEKKELAASLAEKKLPTEGCTGRNGEREKSSEQKKSNNRRH